MLDGTSHVRPDALRVIRDMIPVSSRCLALWSLFSVLSPITDRSIIIKRPQNYYSPFYLIFSIECYPQVVTTQIWRPGLPGRRQYSLARVTCV